MLSLQLIWQCRFFPKLTVLEDYHWEIDDLQSVAKICLGNVRQMTNLLLLYIWRHNGKEIFIQNYGNCVKASTKKGKKGLLLLFESWQGTNFQLSVYRTLSVVLIQLTLFISYFPQRCPVWWFFFVVYLTISGIN